MNVYMKIVGSKRLRLYFSEVSGGTSIEDFENITEFIDFENKKVANVDIFDMIYGPFIAKTVNRVFEEKKFYAPYNNGSLLYSDWWII